MTKGERTEMTDFIKRTLSLFMIFCMLLSLAACGAGAHRADTGSANKIRYNEKYIRAAVVDKPEEQQTYYIFTADTLTYHYYRHSYYPTTSVEHYTVVYRYEVMDEGTLAYFFDSIEFHDDHSASTKESAYCHSNGVLLFSENVLLDASSGNISFIREAYWKEKLTNFGTQENES